MKLYTLFMEGDFGQDGSAFTTEEKAKEFARCRYEEQMGPDADLEAGEKFEDFWNDYCGTRNLEVDPT